MSAMRFPWRNPHWWPIRWSTSCGLVPRTGAEDMDSQSQTRIAAEDYLEALAAHDIEHLFCNPGTDFAPIVEAFARAARTNRKVPRPMVVPHENAALSMAHGYTMITGRPQAVMLHTNVGTANSS